jgi:hypothetical protein
LAGQAEIKAMQKEMLAKMEAKMDDYDKKMMAMWNTNPEAMKIEQDPRMMQSMEEHQEMPAEDATVMPVGELRKRCRVRKRPTESRQKMKKRTPRHATVAWRKRKLLRKSGTRGNCGTAC